MLRYCDKVLEIDGDERVRLARARTRKRPDRDGAGSRADAKRRRTRLRRGHFALGALRAVPRAAGLFVLRLFKRHLRVRGTGGFDEEFRELADAGRSDFASRDAPS